MNPLLGLVLRAPLHGLGLLVWLLPRRLELAAGRALGRAALAVDFKRASVAAENIRRCLPELDASARTLLLRENYEHYGILVLELAHAFTPVPGHYRAYVERWSRVEGLENWRRAHAKGKGTLFCGAHLANWEMAAGAGALAGVPATIVTRRLKPEWVHRWMERARLAVGIRCAYQPRTMPAILKGLRAGDSIGFVMDQYMPPPMGAPLLFFGARVDTLTALVPLARRTGAAITPITQRRDADGVVTLVMEPEFELGAEDRADSQRLADKVEAWVRENPAQWLWAHRRFKHAEWPVGRKTQRA